MLRYQKYAVLFSGAAMLMIILLLFAVKHNEWKQNTAFDIMDAWHYADGSPVSMSGNINYNEKTKARFSTGSTHRILTAGRFVSGATTYFSTSLPTEK